MTRPRRTTGPRLGLLVAVMAALALSPSPALAHALLVSSQPAAGQRLGTAPGVVVLEFSEPINPKLSRASVSDPIGRRFTGSVSGGAEIRVALDTNAPGVYTVEWVSVSTLDGHVVRGSFRFGVGVSPGGTSETARTAPGAADLGLGVFRWIEYLSLLVAVGMLLLRRLARRQPRLDWVRQRIRLPLMFALVSGVVVVSWEAFSAAGTVSLSGLRTYLTTGLPGLARLLRLGFEALALSAGLAGAPALWIWVTAAIGTLAASGHGAAIHPQWWGITVDAVHLVAAGLWAGGILGLATQRPPGGWRSPAGRELLVRFSPPALAAFAVTVGFGAIQAIEELGAAHALVGSSYGRVLVAKIGLVALMLPLSLVAWRLRDPHPRFEGTLAVLVIGAAAVLASFPIPPSRLSVEEAARNARPPLAARPRSGELTLGGHAGEVLVGLTLDPGVPGENRVLVYLLPLEGGSAAARLEATLRIGASDRPLAKCGQTCRRADLRLSGGERVTVHVWGARGGDAVFHIPKLPTPDGAALLAQAGRRMHALHTYRIDETLSSGTVVVPIRYAFEAPNRLESMSRGSTQILIGSTRYLRERPGANWQAQAGGPPLTVPSFIWDYFKPFVDVRVVGRARVGGARATIVSFADGQPGTPIWFRLWIDSVGTVRYAEMRAPGHFMNDRYSDFDAPFTIAAPTE